MDFAIQRLLLGRSRIGSLLLHYAQRTARRLRRLPDRSVRYRDHNYATHDDQVVQRLLHDHDDPYHQQHDDHWPMLSLQIRVQRRSHRLAAVRKQLRAV